MFPGWSSSSVSIDSSDEEIRIGKRRRVNRDRAWTGIFGESDEPASKTSKTHVEFQSGTAEQCEEQFLSGAIDLCAVDLSSDSDVAPKKPPVVSESRSSASIQLPMSRERMDASYGKGFGLLEKMGYRGGGLGRRGDGRVAPVQVKVRTKLKGLDAGDSAASSRLDTACEEPVVRPKRPRPISSWEVVRQAIESSSEEEAFSPVQVVDMTGDSPRLVSASEAVRSATPSRLEKATAEAARRLSEAVKANRRAEKAAQERDEFCSAVEQEMEALSREVDEASALHASMVELARRVTHFEVVSVSHLLCEVLPLSDHPSWSVTDACQVAHALLAFVVHKLSAAGSLLSDVEATMAALTSWRNRICSSEEEVVAFDDMTRTEVLPAVVEFYKLWDPADASGRKLYLLLAQLVHDADHVSFVRNREILPRLKTHLTRLDVDPSDQRGVDKLLHVLSWSGTLSVTCVAGVLCDSFLPRWLAVLEAWTSTTTVRFKEVALWYRGWRSLLPVDLIEDGNVRRFFMAGCRRMLEKASACEARLPSS